MRLEFIVGVLLFSFTYVNAQQHLSKSKSKPATENVTSIKQFGESITIDQMRIINDENLNAFIKDLQVAPIKLSYKLNDMPGLVNEFLENFSPDKFTITNPGGDWNCCCDRNDSRPNRELICQGNNGNLFMISYLTGGIGTVQHLILLRFNSERVTDFWTGMVQGDLRNKAAIIKSLKSHKFQHWATKDRIEI